MDVLRKDFLQKFEKPEKEFLKDKECLICLEPVDIEINQIVQLPCKCANSTYHIPCIIKLLQSGKKKNFCPHCKTKYKILLQQVVKPVFTQVYPQVYPVNPLIQSNYLIELEHAYKRNNFRHIMLVHLLSNTGMNIINICVFKIYPKYNIHPEFQVLMLFYLLKIFFNFCILMYSKSDIEKIESRLIFSYVYQTVMFGVLVCMLSKIKNNYFFTILLANNLLLIFADLAFRIITEYKMQNRVIQGELLAYQ